MLVKTAGNGTSAVVDALIMKAQGLPEELYKSLTEDCGKEMADHKRFTRDTHVQVYLYAPIILATRAERKYELPAPAVCPKDRNFDIVAGESGKGSQAVKRPLQEKRSPCSAFITALQRPVKCAVESGRYQWRESALMPDYCRA
jgi:hypothetical protein